MLGAAFIVSISSWVLVMLVAAQDKCIKSNRSDLQTTALTIDTTVIKITSYCSSIEDVFLQFILKPSP